MPKLLVCPECLGQNLNFDCVSNWDSYEQAFACSDVNYHETWCFDCEDQTGTMTLEFQDLADVLERFKKNNFNTIYQKHNPELDTPEKAIEYLEERMRLMRQDLDVAKSFFLMEESAKMLDAKAKHRHVGHENSCYPDCKICGVFVKDGSGSYHDYTLANIEHKFFICDSCDSNYDNEEMADKLHELADAA